uniref:Ras-like protein family member 10B n=1 Tax=Strigamia maritima TaxID=126957 RepID=T1J6H8_STRMM
MLISCLSVLQQFVWNEFSDEYVPTERKDTYYPAVIVNDHLYELKILDVPVISYFPVNSLYEWSDFRFYGLRNAAAYILVYDLASMDTFQYIKSIRDQIFESRDMHNVPVLVAGNKHDLAGSRDRRDVVNLVKKQWKCSYVECSAKYNWHIVTIFKELMKAFDYTDYGPKPHIPVSMQGSLHQHHRRNKCTIL